MPPWSRTVLNMNPLRQIRVIRVIRGLLPFACAIACAGCSDRTKLQRHLERADAYFDSGAYQEASIEYLNALRIDGTNGVALLGAGLSYCESGKPIQAFPFLQASRDAYPDNLDVRLKLGAMYRAARNIPAARGEALEVLRREPDHFEGLLLLADMSFAPEELEDVLVRLHEQASTHGGDPRHPLAQAHTFFKQGRAEEARRAYEEARAMAPDDVLILEAVGQFYALTDNHAGAEDAFAAAVENASPASAVRVRYAAYLYDRGRHEAAWQLLLTAVESDPAFIRGWEKIGEFALREGRRSECEEAVAAILREYPDHVAGRQLRARMLLLQGESESAIEAFEELLSAYPDSAALHHQVALAYLRDGDVERWREALRETIRLDPDRISARLQLLGLELRAGNAGPVIVRLRKLLETYPNQEEALLLLGRAYAANRESDRALATLEQLRALRPDDHTVPYVMGRILQGMERNLDARHAFESALGLRPGFLPALGGLVALDILDEDPARAVQRLQEAIGRRPDGRGFHHLLGTVHARESRPDEAERAFRKEIEIEPRQIASYVALARLLYTNNRLDDALHEVDDALRINANNPRALMLSGMFCELRGDFSRAVERYEQVLEISPDFAPAANNAAYLYAEEFGDLDKGFVLAQRARDVAPGNGQLADTLGWIAYRRGKYEWALILIQEAADALPDHPVVRFHLGMAQLALGEEQDAAESLRRSLELGDDQLPHPERIADLVRMLDLPLDELAGDAVLLLESVLSNDPGNASAWLRKAILIEQDQRWDDAREIYERILDQRPRFQPALLRLIQLLDVHDQDVARALVLARTAYDHARDDPDITHLSGWLAYRAGDYAWAYGLLRECRRRRPDDPLVSFHVAVSAYSQGGVEEARSFLADAITNGAPPETATFSRLLEASQAEAISPEVRALADSISATDPAYLAALLVSARGHEQAGDVTAAIQGYERLLEQAPRFGPAARNAARLYADELNDDAAAFPLAMTARELLPADPEVSATLGQIVFRRQDFGWARQLLRESVLKRQDDAESHYILGLCLARLDDREAARTVLEKALTIDPDSPRAIEARRILSEGAGIQ